MIRGPTDWRTSKKQSTLAASCGGYYGVIFKIVPCYIINQPDIWEDATKYNCLFQQFGFALQSRNFQYDGDASNAWLVVAV